MADYARFRRIVERLLVTSVPVLGGTSCTAYHTYATQVEPSLVANYQHVDDELDDEVCARLCAPLMQSGVLGDQCGPPAGVDACWVATYVEDPTVATESTAPEEKAAVICRLSLACPAGRRPQGLTASTGIVASSISGAHFAELHRLEAAAVPAFVTLARELEVHGAPETLVRSALTAARDEARHAQAMAGLARRYGALPADAEVAPQPLRSLSAMAMDNAAEGCVREAYGAVAAAWQASHAPDPVVRGVMRRVAVEESGHARLSGAIDEWARSRLPPRSRRRLTNARRHAHEALRAEVANAETDVPGMPDADEARSLVEAI